MDIIDRHGTRRDLTWLQQKYGPSVRFLDAGPGQKFRLVRLEETIGHPEIKIRVLDEHGRPSQNFVALHWINAQPPLPSLEGGGLKTLWHNTGNVQRTDTNGYTSFGFGGGGAYGRDGGPYTLWIASPSFPSDGMSGIGWLGGTTYEGPLSYVFQIGNSTPPAASLREALLTEAERLQVIQFNPSAALQKAIFEASFVPNSPEFTVQWQGKTYVGQRAENLRSGEVRVYYCEEGNWGKVVYEKR